MSKTYQNVSLGAGDVYINGVDTGLQQGPIKSVYKPTMLPLKTGVPLREQGSCVTEEEFSIEFPVLEVTPENLAAIQGRAATTVLGAPEAQHESIQIGGDDIARLSHEPDDSGDVVVGSDPPGTVYEDGVDYVIVGQEIHRQLDGRMQTMEHLLVDYNYSAPVGDRLEFGGLVTLEEVQVQVIHQSPVSRIKETAIIPRGRTEGALDFTYDGATNKYRTVNAKFFALESSDPNWAAQKLGCYYKERTANSGTVTVLQPGDPPPGVVVTPGS